MKRIRFIMFVVTAAALAAGLLVQNRAPLIDEQAVLRELAPDQRFSGKAGSPPHYRSADGTIAFNSYDAAPSVRGYAGPIKTMLVLDPTGAIRGIRIVEHRETKNFVHAMESPGYLSQFIGKKATDPFEVDRDIDAITRATVSVEALAGTVRKSSRIMANMVLGLDVGAEEQTRRKGLAWLWFALLLASAGTAYRVSRSSHKLPWLRNASLAAGFMVIGLVLSSPFSVLQVFNLLLLRPSSSALWYAVVLGVFLSVAVAGRFYCGWLCPFGALSESIARLPFRKWSAPAAGEDRARKIKYFLLAGTLATVLVSGSADYGNYEAFVTLFSFRGTPLAWTLVVLALLANIRVERFWCRYLCPVAALTGLLSRKTAGYPGTSACPMGNRSEPEISECIRCNTCYTGAGKGTGNHD